MARSQVFSTKKSVRCRLTLRGSVRARCLSLAESGYGTSVGSACRDDRSLQELDAWQVGRYELRRTEAAIQK